jgi:hypothetical protein
VHSGIQRFNQVTVIGLGALPLVARDEALDRRVDPLAVSGRQQVEEEAADHREPRLASILASAGARPSAS